MDLQPCLDHIQGAHKGGSNSTYNAKTQITNHSLLHNTTKCNQNVKIGTKFETLNELKLGERD